MRNFRHERNRNQNQNQHNRHRLPNRRPHAQSGRPVNEFERRFLSGTVVDPTPRMRLEAGSKEFTMRAMDLICPIGMGQRGLIVAPPGSGKTTFLKHICQALSKSQSNIKLYCLLIDERPEEVTDFRRSVSAEVRWSSTDQDYNHHIRTANELMKQAFREAGSGENVVVVIDSLTRLARVHNAELTSSGRTLSGGMDARALEIPRRIFGSARKIENGGSLTILATILVDTGSRMDQVIFEEFKGTGNMEIVLSREVSNKRIFPAIDIAKSATRKMELLVEPHELEQMSKIRRVLVGLGTVEAAESLLRQLEKFPTNEELLMTVSKVK
jgi:transcription termination factor Rho